MKGTVIAALIALAVSGCTSQQEDDANALRVLEESGFSHVILNGHAYFACAKNEISSTSFDAVGPTGRKVRGAVCTSIFHVSTIRFN